MTRSPLAVVLAALGLAAAAAAGIWYATLGPRSAPAKLRVPRVVGLRTGAAVRELTQEGLRVRVVEPRTLRPGGGAVVSQAPAPLTMVARGTRVTLRVAARRSLSSSSSPGRARATPRRGVGRAPRGRGRRA